MSIKRCFVIAVAACAMGCFSGSSALAGISGTEAQGRIAAPQIVLINTEQPNDAVTGQSLLDLAAGMHAKSDSGEIADSSNPEVGFAIHKEGSAAPSFFGGDIDIASAFPRRPAGPDFNDAALQLTTNEINLVPVPPAIFTGAFTLAGMAVVKGLKRLR